MVHQVLACLALVFGAVSAAHACTGPDSCVNFISSENAFCCEPAPPTPGIFGDNECVLRGLAGPLDLPPPGNGCSNRRLVCASNNDCPAERPFCVGATVSTRGNCFEDGCGEQCVPPQKCEAIGGSPNFVCQDCNDSGDCTQDSVPICQLGIQTSLGGVTTNACRDCISDAECVARDGLLKNEVGEVGNTLRTSTPACEVTTSTGRQGDCVVCTLANQNACNTAGMPVCRDNECVPCVSTNECVVKLSVASDGVTCTNGQCVLVTTPSPSTCGAAFMSCCTTGTACNGSNVCYEGICLTRALVTLLTTPSVSPVVPTVVSPVVPTVVNPPQCRSRGARCRRNTQCCTGRCRRARRGGRRRRGRRGGRRGRGKACR